MNRLGAFVMELDLMRESLALTPRRPGGPLLVADILGSRAFLPRFNITVAELLEGFPVPNPRSSAMSDRFLPRTAGDVEKLEADRITEKPVVDEEAETVAADRRLIHERVQRDFTYHPPPDEATRVLYSVVRDRIRDLAHVLVDAVPPGRELSRALSSLEDAMMQANAGIARNPRAAGLARRIRFMHKRAEDL